MERYQIGSDIDINGREVPAYALRYNYKVNKRWKGSSAQVLTIHNMGTSCDANLEWVGGPILLYAYQIEATTEEEVTPLYQQSKREELHEGQLYTWACGRFFAAWEFSMDSVVIAEQKMLDERFGQATLSTDKWLWPLWLVHNKLYLIFGGAICAVIGFIIGTRFS